MKKMLLDVIFASDKRKNVLLELMDGEKEIADLLHLLRTSRNALLPQINILEEHHLITHSDDRCELTTIGKTIVEKMIPLLDKIEVLDLDIDYWGTHNIDFLSPELLEGIGKLAKCNIVDPPLESIYTPPEEMYEHCKEAHEMVTEVTEISDKSDFCNTIFTTLYVNTDELISEMLERQISVRFVVSTSLFEKIQDGEYSYFPELLKNKLFQLYVYPKKLDFLSFGYKRHCLLLRLLTNDGKYDNKYMLCTDPEAIEWGEEFFEYHLKDSIQINEINKRTKDSTWD